MPTVFRLILLLLLPLAPLGAAPAACGLHHLHMGIDPLPAADLGLSLRQTAIEHAGTEADYTEIGVGIRRTLGERWSAGIAWPLAVLRMRGATRTGMGNPVGFSEYRLPVGAASRLDLGAQISLPLGNLGEGLADDRFMGMGYAALTRSLGGWDWNAAGGLSLMLPRMEAGHGGGHHAAAASSPLPVAGVSFGNPHENSEVHYRFGAGKNLRGGKAGLTLALDGRHVVGERMMDPQAGRNFLILETGAAFTAGAASLNPALIAPISPSRRIEWGFGLAGTFAFR